MAQLIQGTSSELIRYLEKMRNHKNLLLIVPEEPNAQQSRQAVPDTAIVRNGVPLFPTQGASQIVTMELVKHLMEEE